MPNLKSFDFFFCSTAYGRIYIKLKSTQSSYMAPEIFRFAFMSVHSFKSNKRFTDRSSEGVKADPKRRSTTGTIDRNWGEGGGGGGGLNMSEN